MGVRLPLPEAAFLAPNARQPCHETISFAFLEV